MLTCPATAKPSARRDVANQTCKQTWKAAIDVDPCRAASEAARVTQNVTATTLTNRRKPGVIHKKGDAIMDFNYNFFTEPNNLFFILQDLSSLTSVEILNFRLFKE